MNLVLDFPSDEDIAISHSHEGKGSAGGNAENSKKGEKRKRCDSINNANLSQINDSIQASQVNQKNDDDKIGQENEDQGQHRNKRSRQISEKQLDKQKRRDKRKRQTANDDENDQTNANTDQGGNKIKKRHRDKDVKTNEENQGHEDEDEHETGNGNQSETDQQRRERKIRHRLKKRFREEGRQPSPKNNSGDGGDGGSNDDNGNEHRNKRNKRNKRDRREREREREENSDDDEEKEDDETEREREERHSRRKKKRKLEKLKQLATDRERDQLHWLAEDIDYASQKQQNKHIRLAYDKSKFRYENHFSVDASFLESPEAMAPEKIKQSIEREQEILTRHQQHEREKARIKALKDGARAAAAATCAGSGGSGSGSGPFTFSSDAPLPYIPTHEERTINLVGLASIEDIQFVNPLASEAKILKDCHSKERVKDTEQRTLRDLFDVLTSDPRNRDWFQGDDLVDLANQLLDAFKEVRSPDQFDVHTAIMETCTPHIYAQDFDERRVEILKKQQRTAFVMSALIMTPRRWGKTMATAMAMAVLLYVCRKVTIVTFATGQDISNAFLATTRALYLQLPDARKRILDNSKSTFYCRRMDDDMTRPSGLVMDSKDYNCILARVTTECVFLLVLYRFVSDFFLASNSWK